MLKSPASLLLFIITVYLIEETKLRLRFTQLIAEARDLHGKEKIAQYQWPKCYNIKINC